MAKQAGLGTFLGSFMDIIGYADDDRLLFRMNGTLCKKKWRRHPSFAGQREAARFFGAASMIAAGIWKNVPEGMKRIMGKGAYSRLVAVCRMLVEEDGNVGDVDGFRGVDFSECADLPLFSGGDGDLMRDEGGGMRVACASADFDEGLKINDESLAAFLDGGGTADGAFGGGGAGAVTVDSAGSAGGGAETVDSAGSAVNGFGGATKRRFCVAEPWRDDDDPDFVVEHERLGTISAFREGLRALRAEMGRPVVRRRRVWVSVCEVPTVQWVPGGVRGGAFFLVQKGRYWLGKGSCCSPWVVDSGGDSYGTGLMRVESGGMRVPLPGDFDESGKMKEERIRSSPGALGIWARGMDVRGLVDEAVMEARLSSERSEVCSGVFLVMVGLEVAEKRGRHWVRVPQLCRVRVADVKQNSQDSQNLKQNSQDSQNLQNLNGLNQNSQDSLNLEQNLLDSQNLQNWEQNLQDSQNLQNWEQNLLDSQNLQNWEQNCLRRSEDLQDLGGGEVGDLGGSVADLGGSVADLVVAGAVLEFKDGFEDLVLAGLCGGDLDWVGGGLAASTSTRDTVRGDGGSVVLGSGP